MTTNPDQIKKAALRLFANKGYEATSIYDITNAVGISKPGFYYHFVSKEELFLNILKEIADQLTDQINRSLNDSQPGNTHDILMTVFTAAIKYFENKSKLLFWNRATIMAVSETDLKKPEKLNNLIYDHEQKFRELLINAIEKSTDGKTENIKTVWLFDQYIRMYLYGMLTEGKRPDLLQAHMDWERFWKTASD